MTGRRHEMDAIIVGYGPVGAVAANMFGSMGWRTAVIERSAGIFPLPRAAMIDGQTCRLLQEIGLGDYVREETEGSWGAEFVDASGACLLRLETDAAAPGPMGWPDGSFIYQPEFEAALRRQAEAHDGVRVFTGHEMTSFQQDANGVTAQITPAQGGESFTLTAAYLLGCDGAASPVRTAMGSSLRSLGYDRHWLVMDVRLKTDVRLPRLAQQVCSPARAAAFVPMLRNYRRWEFRLEPGETPEEMMSAQMQWRLLEPWLKPGQAEILRSAVYRFHGAIADAWRNLRVFLLGDAAHQMPPFLGQGMCTGMRDVANLAWKLDLVERGLAPSALLDTYQEERQPHALDVADSSVQVGRLIDAFTEAQTGSSKPPKDAVYGGGRKPHLHGGVRAGGSDGITGYPLPQPQVIDGAGHRVLLDGLMGPHFAIISRRDARAGLRADQLAFLERIGARFITLSTSREADDKLTALLDAHDAIIVRPDRYVFALADAAHPLAGRVDLLAGFFHLPQTARKSA